MYLNFWNLSTSKSAEAGVRCGTFKCGSCGTYYDPTYGGCPTCSRGRAHWIAPALLLTLCLLVSANTALAEDTPTKPLFGSVFTDLNGNGTKDFGERTVPGIVVEARHIDSTIIETWSAVSESTGDYRMLLWDPGRYDVTAYCTATGDGLSSISVCWQSKTPITIAGTAQTINIPLPAQQLYLPIIAGGAQ